jgi:hypothetical protein
MDFGSFGGDEDSIAGGRKLYNSSTYVSHANIEKSIRNNKKF